MIFSLPLAISTVESHSKMESVSAKKFPTSFNSYRSTVCVEDIPCNDSDDDCVESCFTIYDLQKMTNELLVKLVNVSQTRRAYSQM
jgi:hypothetical protein